MALALIKKLVMSKCEAMDFGLKIHQQGKLFLFVKQRLMIKKIFFILQIYLHDNLHI